MSLVGYKSALADIFTSVVLCWCALGCAGLDCTQPPDLQLLDRKFWYRMAKGGGAPRGVPYSAPSTSLVPPHLHPRDESSGVSPRG